MRGLEQIPSLYDALMAVADWRGLRRWRAWLAGGARGRTLEIGCGTGRNLPRYGREASPIGLEPEWDALQRARARAPQVPLVQASAEALPFKDGTFDTVVSSLVFCSVENPERGLDEIRRVMAPGGTLRMLEHVRAIHPFAARIQDAIQPIWTWAAGGCRPNRDTERAVERAGFEILAEGRRADGLLRRFVARPR